MSMSTMSMSAMSLSNESNRSNGGVEDSIKIQQKFAIVNFKAVTDSPYLFNGDGVCCYVVCCYVTA